MTLRPGSVSRGEYLHVKGRGWRAPTAPVEGMYFGLRGPKDQRIHIGNANIPKRGRWTFASGGSSRRSATFTVTR